MPKGTRTRTQEEELQTETSKKGRGSRVRALTQKQEAFCVAYAVPDEDGKNLSIRSAYQVAYPDCENERIASNNASKLLKDPRIRARISDIRNEIKQRWIDEQLPFTMLVKVIRDGIGAKSVVTAKFEGKITDREAFVDYGTRAKYVEMALKLRGDMPAEEHHVRADVQVVDQIIGIAEQIAASPIPEAISFEEENGTSKPHD